MSGTKLISTRLTVCAACGHDSRLVALTSEEVISRCYACGDVTRTPQPTVPPPWVSVAGSPRRHRGDRDGQGPLELPASRPTTPVAAG
jgi:hypothetical protein